MFKRVSCFYALFICLISLNVTIARTQKITHNLSAEEHYARGLEYFERKKYTKASESFATVFLTNPSSPIVPDAKVMEGKSAWLAKDYVSTAVILEEFVNLYPKHPELEEAYHLMTLAEYKRATYQRDYSQMETAKMLLEHFINRFPENKNVPYIKEKLYPDIIQKMCNHKMEIADYYFAQRNYSAARQRYYDIAESYPDSKKCYNNAVLGLHNCDRFLLGTQESLASYYDKLEQLRLKHKIHDNDDTPELEKDNRKSDKDKDTKDIN